MKNFLLIFIFSSSFLFSQEYYWTSYSFNVDPEDIETVGKLTDDYFSKEGSKADGVTVFLFENHFRDGTINASHSLVFYGTQEAMGSQYSSGQNTDFQLYLTKMGQLTKSHSSAAGKSLISIGTPGNYPIQAVYWMKVQNASQFAKGFGEYQKKYAPKNRRVTLGSFNLGRSPYGETHYILVGVESFMEAFDVGKFRESNKSSMSAWVKFIESNEGNVEFVRSTTRVMMGKW